VTGPLGNSSASPPRSPATGPRASGRGGVGVAPLAPAARRFSVARVLTGSCSAPRRGAQRWPRPLLLGRARSAPRCGWPARTGTAGHRGSSPTLGDAGRRTSRLGRLSTLRAAPMLEAVRSLCAAAVVPPAGARDADGLRLRALLGCAVPRPGGGYCGTACEWARSSPASSSPRCEAELPVPELWDRIRQQLSPNGALTAIGVVQSRQDRGRRRARSPQSQARPARLRARGELLAGRDRALDAEPQIAAPRPGTRSRRASERRVERSEDERGGAEQADRLEHRRRPARRTTAVAATPGQHAPAGLVR